MRIAGDCPERNILNKKAMTTMIIGSDKKKIPRQWKHDRRSCQTTNKKQLIRSEKKWILSWKRQFWPVLFPDLIWNKSVWYVIFWFDINQETNVCTIKEKFASKILNTYRKNCRIFHSESLWASVFSKTHCFSASVPTTVPTLDETSASDLCAQRW